MGNFSTVMCAQCSSIMTEAVGRMVGYLLATIFFAAALVMTLAALVVLLLGSMFSLLIHDYITSSQQLVGLAMLGLILLLPAVARGSGRDATLLDAALALSGVALLLAVLAGLLRFSLLLPVALCVLFGTPITLCWCQLCLLFPDWMQDFCCDFWPSRLRGSEPLLAAERPKVLDMSELMETYFDQCFDCGRELLKRRPDVWLTKEDLEAMMPDVIVGLPALALLRVLEETLQKGQAEGFFLADGSVLTDANRPGTRGAAEAYRWALEAKKALAELKPTSEECLFIEARALWEDTSAPNPELREGSEVAARGPLRCTAPGVAGLFGATCHVAGRGHVTRLLRGKVEVAWPSGRGLHRAADLADSDGRRQLHSAWRGEPPDPQRRRLAVVVAGRLRSVATFFTRMPFFQQNFRSKVLEPLLKGHDQWRDSASPARSPPSMSRLAQALGAAAACELARLA